MILSNKRIKKVLIRPLLFANTEDRFSRNKALMINTSLKMYETHTFILSYVSGTNGSSMLLINVCV